MITEEEVKQARETRDAADKIINQYGRERIERFEQRLRDNPIFTDDELVYSETTLCPCGHGLAYPKDCSPGHYWDCSAILKGIQDKTVTHTGQLPFAFYKIRSEGENPSSKLTTRGAFRPKQQQSS